MKEINASPALRKIVRATLQQFSETIPNLSVPDELADVIANDIASGFADILDGIFGDKFAEPIASGTLKVALNDSLQDRFADLVNDTFVEPFVGWYPFYIDEFSDALKNVPAQCLAELTDS